MPFEVNVYVPFRNQNRITQIERRKERKKDHHILLLYMEHFIYLLTSSDESFFRFTAVLDFVLLILLNNHFNINAQGHISWSGTERSDLSGLIEGYFHFR